MYLILSLLLLAALVFYRYYLKPKAQIRRYVALLKSLGYRVYEMPFAFLGLSFFVDWERSMKQYKDAMHMEKTVYPQVDVTIGNILDKVQINLVKTDLIKEFLSINVASKYPKFQMLIAGIRATTGDGIIFNQGDVWKNKRKLMSKVFNFDIVKENISKMGQICDRCYDSIEKSHKIGQNTFKYDPLALGSRVFNGVMMKCFFGYDHIKDEIKGQNYEQFVIDVLTESSQVTLSPIMVLFGKWAWKLGLTGKIRKVKENIRLFREKSIQIINKRTEEALKNPKNDKRTDIISAIIYERQENKDQFSYSEEDLVAEFQTFVAAGTDSTARYYTMMVYYLGTYPHIQQRLRKEVESVIKSDEDINYENLKKLTYIDWLQLETTRHYGPANGIFWRIASEDNYLLDIPIKKGMIINTQPAGNHYSTKYYNNPEEFRPERWEKECDGIDPYAILGFNAGPRTCIGKQLAQIQSKVALIKLIKRYKTIEVPKEIVFKVGLLYEVENFDVTYTK